MIMLIHRICMALSGLGKFISVAREMSVRAAMLLEASRGQSGLTTVFMCYVFITTFGTRFHSRAQLEAHKVLDVVVDPFSLLDGRPGGREHPAG